MIQHWSCAALALGVIAGCASKDIPPCQGVAVGDRYELELVEVYDENSSFPGGETRSSYSCGPEFGPWVGDTPVVIVASQAYDDGSPCKGARVLFENPEQWGWEDIRSRNAETSGYYSMEARYDMRVMGCEGWLDLKLAAFPADAEAFIDSEPGTEPFFRYGQAFRSIQCPWIADNCAIDPNACPPNGGTGCGNILVVNVHKLE